MGKALGQGEQGSVTNPSSSSKQKRESKPVVFKHEYGQDSQKSILTLSSQ